MTEQVILVDENDNEIGTEEKLAAHKKGLLHRAFSIYIFNDKNELMLQKRAVGKYHSGGLWTNTCCSHPRPGEDLLKAAHRKLKSEMGFDTKLNEKFFICYKSVYEDLTENEYLHVLFGKYEESPKLNPDEAMDWKWIGLENLKDDIAKNPQNYTSWFKIVIEKIDINTLGEG